MIDMRSDTVTLPTDEMREAMAKAVVGDDVMQEDPTVRELQALAAEKTGMEDALFVPSGTMGNLIGILTHTHGARRGEVICEAKAHVRLNEGGGMAVIGGLMCSPIVGKDGMMDPAEVEADVRIHDIHHPDTALICLENTHNFAGGAVLPLSHMAEIRAVADKYGLPVHLDGARVFNAAAALHVDVKEITQYVDSVNVCISKGLSAPVGSMLCGSRAFIEQARFYRKMLGGGMRQAGVLAAAGIIALETMSKRVYEDNEHAHALAVGIKGILPHGIDPDKVKTNIVIFDVAATGMTAVEFADKLKEHGVLVSTVGPTLVRFVTHRHITAGDLPVAIAAVRKVVG